MPNNSAHPAGTCPFLANPNLTKNKTSAGEGTRNKEWWPDMLDLSILRLHSDLSNPMDKEFDYPEAFKTLDYQALKKDLNALMTDSQEWWPADFGHYGPFFIRMSWHSAGTYRLQDGRGGGGQGQQRFAPHTGWPDNANLDKARRLLWPIKQKYGSKISWADLIVLTGNVALESMGAPVVGFAGGRPDTWEADTSVYWGSERKWLTGDKRYAHSGEMVDPPALGITPAEVIAANSKGQLARRALENPLAASEMGLIYVNPEGPEGVPDPIAAAKDTRDAFERMAMNDEETVALIAGGHSLGKTHGVAPYHLIGHDPNEALGPNLEQQGLGWKNSFRTGKGADTNSSGVEVTWSSTPTQWSHEFLHNLFEYDWVLEKSYAGKHQWVASNGTKKIPHPTDSSVKRLPRMLTTDLALRYDPAYEKICRKFMADPEYFDKVFADSWFKLLHRDMGPIDRYHGPEIPQETYIWQDPVRTPVGKNDPKAIIRAISTLGGSDVVTLKSMIAKSNLAVGDLVSVAWSSASTFRCSDKRGGANGARIRLHPLRGWASNNEDQLNRVLAALEGIQKEFNGDRKAAPYVSVADLIILGGCVAIEKATGGKYVVPFLPGRGDCTQDQIDVTAFVPMEPAAEGFRNFLTKAAIDAHSTTESMLVDRANLLGLTGIEMTALVGGMRVLGTNVDGSDVGVLTDKVGTLTNDFFLNILDMTTEWKPQGKGKSEYFDGTNSKSGQKKWTVSRVDLIFSAHPELRALAEVYAECDGLEKFIPDFIKAWVKVMNSDRFDVKRILNGTKRNHDENFL